MTDPIQKRRAILRAAVERLPKIVRFRALNALNGFEKAVNLLEVDREMASFRAMTAQEEAAAALFKALQYQRYPGAARLNPWKHEHKWALWPVMDAARMAVGKAFKGGVNVMISADPPKVTLSTPLSSISSGHPPEFDGHSVIIEDPLDMYHRINGSTNLFAEELEEIAVLNGHESVKTFLAETTNHRNLVLYATDGSLPKSNATLESIETRRGLAEAALVCAIIVLQTTKFQAYALQALESLLTLVAKADQLDMPYPDPDPQAVHLDLPTQQNEELADAQPPILPENLENDGGQNGGA